MIEKVKKAREMVRHALPMTRISEETGIDRKAIKPLVDLYDAIEQRPMVKEGYVCIKKRYLVLKEIRQQHRWADMRQEFHRSMEQLNEKRSELEDIADRIRDARVTEADLRDKEKMLIVTRNNLKYAEAQVELMRKDRIYDRAAWSLGGMILALFLVAIYGWFLR